MLSHAEQPRDEFEGLSPQQMQQLFQDFLGPGSIVKLRGDVPAEVLQELPLIYFIRQFLDRLAEKEIKLTAKGNLPGKLVKDFYATGRLPDYAIEAGITKLKGEDDYAPAQVVKYLPDLLGWSKKRHGKLSLTQKGKKARALPAGDFFEQVFRAHFRHFNLGWADGYPEASDVQHAFPYVAYLLLILGRDTRESEEYSRRLRQALPMVDTHFGGYKLEQVVFIRLFLRFLAYYGFVKVEGRWKSATVSATERFYEVFHLDRDARLAPPSEEEEYERQLRTALFDAEMGGQSWTSGDIPLEALEAFHAQVRDLEARREAGDTVVIRELLDETRITPPSGINDPAAAERAITDLLDLLAAISIRTERPDELEALPYYAFLYDMLLEHEVVPPGPGQSLLLPFEEIFLTHYRPHERVTEWFLLGLFSLGDPFPEDLLASKMRLHNRVVPRSQGLAYIADWQARFREIVAIGFAPVEDHDLPAPSERQAVQPFHVTYEVVHADDGRRETLEGPGVVELLLEQDQWVVTGAQFPGFTL